MFPASFGYLAPRSMEETLDLLTTHGEDAKILAGGHSLIPAMKLRLTSPRYLIDIAALPGLRGIKMEGDNLIIGALTIHAEVASSELIKQRVPGLAEAALAIGDMQVRNRGTIGGSVAHNDPGADFPVILTALNASFVLQSPSGKRTVPVDDFFVDFFTTAMAGNEVLTEVRVPVPPPQSGTAYVKFPHPASGYVVVSAGVLLTRQSSGQCDAVRLAIGGVGSGPVRASATEAALSGQSLSPDVIASAAAKAADGTDPTDDIYATGEYKRHMATVYARRAIEAAVQRAGTNR
jgi:carbon-monoxide dehydrogenase medium subunit